MPDFIAKHAFMEELKKTDNIYKSLIEVTNTAFVIIDENGRVLDANSEYARLAGRKNQKELIGKSVTEWTAPHDVKRNKLEVEKCFKKGFVKNLEIEYIHPDGKLIPVEINATIYKKNGEKFIFSLIQDISFRKNAEKRIKKNEAFLQSIFLAAPVGIGVVSNRVFIMVNKKFCEITGYEANEVINKTANMLYPSLEEFEKVGKVKYQQIQKHGTGTVETTWVKKDGTVIKVLLSSTPLDRNNLEAGVTFTALDISERYKAKMDLIDSEAKFSSLFNNSSDGILVADPVTRQFKMANAEICKMLGYNENELLNMNVNDIHPEGSLPFVLNAFKAQLEKKIKIAENLPVKRKDGSIFFADISSNPIKIHGQKLLAGFFRDISERKQIQDEITVLLKKISEKNRELESIVYVASHDLRTPLVNIIGFGQELEINCEELEKHVNSLDFGKNQEDFKKLLNEEIRPNLEFIQHSSKKMNKLIYGLLKISRLGRSSVKLTDINMNHLIKSMLKNLQYKISKNKIKCETGNLPNLKADKEKISQVFSNLLDNAIKYMDPKRPGKIKISGESLDSKTIYRISDNGIGIEKNHQLKIFEIFHRLHPKTSPHGEGLGLSIVNKIIEMHYGKTWVESDIGKGTTFFIELPK